MATSYRQLAFQRKLIYLGVVIALFSGSLVWRRVVVEAKADTLALREQNQGDVDLMGVVMRNALIGSRGFVTCAMWMEAIELKKKNKWNELELTTRAITKLQPHMISPWQFQSWNLTFNVSVESDRIRDKYYWVTRGISLMAEGERQNRVSPILRRDIGSFQEFKICRSDENNVMRSLFQLSCIPPKERNPDRFWVRHPAEEGQTKGEVKRLKDGSKEVDLVEFEKFCRAHPQLIRRLAAPPLVSDPRKEWPRYQVANVQEVVEFLEENYNVPTLFAEELENEDRYNEMLAKKSLADRFPVLPPERGRPFADYPGEEWTDQNILVRPRDHFNGYHVSRAWYAYAQELLPPPHPEFPDMNSPVKDPTKQRIPKSMSTVLFRMGPGLTQRHVAERLAEEGWFEKDEAWQLKLPYQRGLIGQPGKTFDAELKETQNWSQEAWRKSFLMWKNYGERNHVLVPENELITKQQNAGRYHSGLKKAGLDPSRDIALEVKGHPDLEEYRKAALFMFGYHGARSKTNFDNHYHQSQVEAQGAGPGKENETVLARKAFYKAERIRRNTLNRRGALKLFDEGAVHWREVLKNNPRFQEYLEVDRETTEIELKYVRQYADLHGRETKELLALQNFMGQSLGGSGLGGWTSLGLATTPNRMPTLVIYGPFAEAEDGEAFYTESQRKAMLDQLKLSEKAATIREGRKRKE